MLKITDLSTSYIYGKKLCCGKIFTKGLTIDMT